MTGIRNTRKKRRAEKNLVDTRIMRSFGETPGKREALLNKLVKISETPVKREETPEKGEEPLTARNLQQMNMPPEQIAQAVGADIDTVRKWLSDS